MRKLILALFFPIISIGQTKINSKVNSVVIYKSGAQVIREANLDLKIGENSFVFKGISPELDKNSIQVTFSDPSITINSLSHQLSLNNDYEYSDLSSKIALANTAILKEKKKLETENTLLSFQEKLLLSNQNVGGTNVGMKTEDLIKTVDYFEMKLKKILYAQNIIENKLDSLDFEIKENNRELNGLSSKSSNKLSEIIIDCKSKQVKSQVKVIIKYFLKNAGWTPTYDFNAKSLDRPLSVIYKSKIFQYSGEDWKDVKVTLSNSIPKANSSIPNLLTWIWGIPNDYSYYNQPEAYTNNLSEVWGTIKDETGQVIPGANVTIKGTSLGTTSDANGNFRLNIPNDRIKLRNELMVSFIGYVTANVAVNASPVSIILKEDSQSLQEVVVMGYSANSDNEKKQYATALSGRAAGVNITNNANSKAKNVRNLVEEKENPVSIEFAINETMTLNSDGKEKVIELKEIEIPVNYVYKSVPKIELSAFLTAKIFEWEQFNFIPGEANMYFEGTYVGKSQLDLSNKDTLSLSLGRDQSIKIERKQVKNYSKKQILGQNINSQYTYEISVRNTKNQEIDILIEDQFPITANKDVEISDKLAEEATVNSDSGIINWKYKVPKVSQKTFNFKYSVKYPKNMMIEE